MSIDVSELLGLDSSVKIEADNLQKLLDLKNSMPDIKVTVGDKFIDLHNSDGTHVISFGIIF